MENRTGPGQRDQRLKDAYPDLVAEITELLRASQPGDPLADSIVDLPFYGVCSCSPTCEILLTKPSPVVAPWIVVLEREGEAVFFLGIDQSQATVSSVEVLDGRDLTGCLSLSS
ncbi:hypothetical protein ACFU6I_16045 [Streptomyces sp. NPDC057486]|uniref:hypothetical protein n=1 Tax=Streptomyces sp. NPDC057486 TaxID=3346145 RepID=UPI003697721B